MSDHQTLSTKPPVEERSYRAFFEVEFTKAKVVLVSHPADTPQAPAPFVR